MDNELTLHILLTEFVVTAPNNFLICVKCLIITTLASINILKRNIAASSIISPLSSVPENVYIIYVHIIN